MERRCLFGANDFFPKDLSFGKAHSASCECDTCLESSTIFAELSAVSHQILSHEISSVESKKLCDLVDFELLEKLHCGSGEEFDNLVTNFNSLWQEQLQAKPISHLQNCHQESCGCIVCAAKTQVTSKLDEICSSKTLEDAEFLEIIEERILRQIKQEERKKSIYGNDKSPAAASQDEETSYLLCQQNNPMIVNTSCNGIVDSIIDANTQEKIFSRDETSQLDKNVFYHKKTNNDFAILVSSGRADVKLEDLHVEEINLNDVVDICLCEPGQLSPYCLKHSVAYCQHMHNKLYEDGCSCTRENECLFCQRLKCNYCSHERSLPTTCPNVTDPETDDLTLMVSSWLDNKLEEAGVPSDLIKQFSEPLLQNKTDSHGAKPQDEDLAELFAKHLERSLADKTLSNCNPIESDLFISDKMRDEILNMNLLFDLRPFPRCYRLKGVKNNEGVGYSGMKEEYMDLGFETWKLPNQFPEDTLPVTAPLPDVESRMDKEDEIRKRAKNVRSSTVNKKVKVVGLSDEWRPVVKPLETSDYSQNFTQEQKQQWADKTYEEIMEKSYHLFESRGDEDQRSNQLWSKVQPILDKYGEESVPSGTQTQSRFDLETFLKNSYQYTQQIAKRFKNSKTISYKPEFWEGLEDWKPPKSENEVRKRLIDEVKNFSKELDSFKNDFERALSDRPGIDINVEETLNDLICRLPSQLQGKVAGLKNNLPESWVSDPDSALEELESVSLRPQVVKPKSSVTNSSGFEEKHRAERTTSECDSFQISDEDDHDPTSGKKEVFFYDDEEQADDMRNDDEMESSSFEKEVTLSGNPEDSIVEDNRPFIVSSLSSKFNHRPAPYVTKLKEEMLKNCPEGLHPTQKLWYDKPMYPFWTPSILYDLSQIEKLFFDGVAEYSPDINMSKLKDLEKRLLNRYSNVVEEVEEIVEELEASAVVDEADTSVQPKTDLSISQTPKSLAKSVKKPKSEKKSKKSAKSASSEDCLIKEDDFKLAIEQLLIAEAKKKEAIKEKESSEGGALSLEQIKKGIAGRVIASKEGALQLDCTCDIDLESIVPSPALKYNFKLDLFQKQAIVALEAGLSVFVAAHTSAGKTVAAEYAIAMALRNGCRVVYTSPIKALSNQKYNDFTKKFKGKMRVGIITGDVQLNKEAECLIMTTEILRSMLYNQSSILSDLEYVIFDEVHYFNDPERGNVWEEVLILLPHQCQLVMLSATVPNVMNFASWVGSLRKREVIVTMTNRRPVPLKHYIHYSTKPKHVSDVLLIRQAEGRFLSANFQNAMKMKEFSKPKGGHNSMNPAKMWSSFIIGHLQKHSRLPAVVFCFSRKRCDELATQIKNVDLVNDSKKRQHIENFFNRQINMLQEEDRDIKQIVTMKGLLQKGIGVHHSGILPILKEIVEVLFSESQIKLLFATETFAMGVNMPAKTVVFQQVCKFDGIVNRPLKPGEYTQMAGRAGRRGIDKSGTVIITEWNTKREKCVREDDLCDMLTGSVEPLTSQFRLRYSMILTALKPEGENSIPSIIQKSFFDFSLKAEKSKTQEMTEKDYSELKKLKEEMVMIPPGLRDDLINYCNITHHFFLHHEHIRERMFAHNSFKILFTPGRLVVVCYNRYLNVYGVILNVDQQAKTFDIAVMKSSRTSILPTQFKQVYEKATSEDEIAWLRLISFRKMELLPLSHVGTMDPSESLEIITCKASHIHRIVKRPVHKLNRAQVVSIIDSIRSRRYHNDIQVETLTQLLMEPAWNPHSISFCNEEEIRFNQPDMQVDVLNYFKMSRSLQENLFNVSLPSDYPLLDYLGKCYWFLEKSREIDKRKVQAQKDELKSLFKDFDSKLIFLKNNKYIKDDSDVVDTKGRIASRMTNFEVFVTEILLKNVLEDLNGAETAALLSCLVIPGVSTTESCPITQPNPLFKPMVIPDVDDPADINIPTDPSKMSRQDLRKKLNEFGNKRNESQKAIYDENALVFEYLDIPESLIKAINIVDEIRRDLIRQEEELEIVPMEGSDLNKVSFYLVPIIYAWATGKPMKEIMQVLVPNIQEGILVRWVINLNETIKDIDSAIHHFLKDSRIKEKFETASNCIKRGIIDTPSLYLNQRSQN